MTAMRKLASSSRGVGLRQPSSSPARLALDALVLTLPPAAFGVAILFAQAAAAPWHDYEFTVILVFFIMRSQFTRIAAAVLARHSMLFQTMDHTWQMHDADLLVEWAWFFFWAPVSMVVYAQVFRLDTASFASSWAPLGRMLLFAGLFDQFYELTMRRRVSLFFFSHHVGETRVVLLLQEWVPSVAVGRAVFILATQSCLDRLVKVVYPMAHLRKQYELQNGPESDALRSGALGQLDTLVMLPHFPQILRFVYRVAFLWYCIIVRLLVVVSMAIFLTLNWDDISAPWHIALPVAVAFFCAIDAEFYKDLYARGFTSPLRHDGSGNLRTDSVPAVPVVERATSSSAMIGIDRPDFPHDSESHSDTVTQPE